jgi:hypothetical protein
VTENTENRNDKLFHDALAEWEAQPSPAIWDKIEAVLDEEDKRRPAIWWWVMGVLFLIMGSTAVWYFWPKEEAPRQYSVHGSSLENPLKPGIDSSFAINYRQHSSIPDSVKQDLQKQADSINSPTAIAAANKNTVVQQKPVTRTNTSALTASSTPVHNIPVGVSVSTNTTRPKTITNNSVVVTTKSTPIKKDSASTPSHKKTEQPIVASTAKPAQPKSTAQKTTPKTDSIKNPQQQTATPLVVATNTIPPTNTEVKKTSTKDSVPITQNTNPVIKKNDSVQATTQTTTNKIVQKKTDSLKTDSITKAAKKDSTNTVKTGTQPKDSAHPLIPPHLFSIAIYYAPEIARNDATVNNTMFNIQNTKTNLRYSMGAKFGMSFGNKLELNIGLAYSQFNQSLGPDTVSFSKNITQPFIFNSSLGDMSVPAATMMAGYAPPPWVSRVHYNYQYSQSIQFINIPINARMNFGMGKLKPYATAGINIQYALSTSATLDLLKEAGVTDELTYSNLNVTKLNIGTSIGIGLEYSITKHLSAFIEPDARLNLLSLSGSTKSTNYFAGCQGGIKIGL